MRIEGLIESMAKARAIVKRRKAVRNIRKITKTMQMIATAKFQKSLKRATGTKPYTQKVREKLRSWRNWRPPLATSIIRRSAGPEESGLTPSRGDGCRLPATGGVGRGVQWGAFCGTLQAVRIRKLEEEGGKQRSIWVRRRGEKAGR